MINTSTSSDFPKDVSQKFGGVYSIFIELKFVHKIKDSSHPRREQSLIYKTIFTKKANLTTQNVTNDAFLQKFAIFGIVLLASISFIAISAVENFRINKNYMVYKWI